MLYTHKITYQEYCHLYDVYLTKTFRTTADAVELHKQQICNCSGIVNFTIEIL